jgi:hypothetical protein
MRQQCNKVVYTGNITPFSFSDIWGSALESLKKRFHKYADRRGPDECRPRQEYSQQEIHEKAERKKEQDRLGKVKQRARKREQDDQAGVERRSRGRPRKHQNHPAHT